MCMRARRDKTSSEECVSLELSVQRYLVGGLSRTGFGADGSECPSIHFPVQQMHCQPQLRSRDSRECGSISIMTDRREVCWSCRFDKVVILFLDFSELPRNQNL